MAYRNDISAKESLESGSSPALPSPAISFQLLNFSPIITRLYFISLITSRTYLMFSLLSTTHIFELIQLLAIKSFFVSPLKATFSSIIALSRSLGRKATVLFLLSFPYFGKNKPASFYFSSCC